ncbi:triose-phosphate isomerase [candidate division GN15 bacterium]|uniref:Triosephosphate isomerase n=1 Tax=candidate division GN15 bacterium TaxID=2072418 RepID=A0A855WXA1_9BACT|nr:MAG: triose-phosphate isomerase [candidate division GN15 bacterium]
MRFEMRRKIIAGNWKMNGTVGETEALIKQLLTATTGSGHAETVVCPPFTSLMIAAKLLKGSHIGLGAQDMSQHAKGAFTGEISAELLLTLGVRFVILGHSERRQYHFETDGLVNLKTRAALAAGLTPIVCVGETLEQRENGHTESVIREQIQGTMSGFGADELRRIVIAYEPVWAIGTGRTATPDQAQEVHRSIRQLLARIDDAASRELPILYGGSVKADNARGLLSQPDIDGALVGGASLKADEFVQIINAA